MGGLRPWCDAAAMLPDDPVLSHLSSSREPPAAVHPPHTLCPGRVCGGSDGIDTAALLSAHGLTPGEVAGPQGVVAPPRTETPCSTCPPTRR